VPGTSGQLELPDAIKARLLCHQLLILLPDQALVEAIESLAEMWRFYRTPALDAPQLPAVDLIPASYGGTYAAPVYPVTEE
jgi:hypothetical protein